MRADRRTSIPLVLCLLAATYVGQPPAGAEQPTAAEAEQFLAEAERTVLARSNDEARHGWVQATFITEDTDLLYAEANERYIAAVVDLAKRATRYADLDLPEDQRRQLDLLRLALSLPAPEEPALRGELTRIAAGMESAYGRGRYCTDDGECRDLGELSRVMAAEPRSRAAGGGLGRLAHHRAPAARRVPALRRARQPGRPRARVRRPGRHVALQVRHAAGRASRPRPSGCGSRSGRSTSSCTATSAPAWSSATASEVVPPDGPIPAHLLGNMWAQSWGNIYDLVAPPGDSQGVDLTALLVEAGVDRAGMVRYGEGFFTSLGFAPLPETFWQRSLFEQAAGP